MPTISDYVILADNQTTLEIGGLTDKAYPFSLPSNLNTGNPAIATWQLEAESPSALKWQISINGSEIAAFTHNQDRFGAVQEVFAGSILRTGDNRAEVKVISGRGRIRISDSVVHFQANV